MRWAYTYDFWSGKHQHNWGQVRNTHINRDQSLHSSQVSTCCRKSVWSHCCQWHAHRPRQRWSNCQQGIGRLCWRITWALWLHNCLLEAHSNVRKKLTQNQ